MIDIPTHRLEVFVVLVDSPPDSDMVGHMDSELVIIDSDSLGGSMLQQQEDIVTIVAAQI